LLKATFQIILTKLNISLTPSLVKDYMNVLIVNQNNEYGLQCGFYNLLKKYESIVQNSKSLSKYNERNKKQRFLKKEKYNKINSDIKNGKATDPDKNWYFNEKSKRNSRREAQRQKQKENNKKRINGDDYNNSVNLKSFTMHNFNDYLIVQEELDKIYTTSSIYSTYTKKTL